MREPDGELSFIGCEPAWAMTAAMRFPLVFQRVLAQHVEARPARFDSDCSRTAGQTWMRSHGRKEGRSTVRAMCRTAKRKAGAGRLADRPADCRRGLTLLESMIAAAILLVAVIAVSSAMTAGQHHAYEAQLRISGAIAAEDLMGRLNAVAYSDLVTNWDGFEETPGDTQTQQSEDFPSAFNRIGRRVVIIDGIMHTLPGLNVKIHGLTVQVMAFDDRGETLVTLSRFIPQPQHVTVPGAGSDDDLDSGNYIRTLLEDVGDGMDDFDSLLNSTDLGSLGGGLLSF